jgi:hypothetical protein
MNIIIKDEQGLGFALMMDDYSQPEIWAAKQTIRKQFKDAATMVFTDVLNKPLPETMVVDLAQNTTNELEGGKSARMASFNSELSRSDYLVFSVHELTIKKVLEHSNEELFRATIIHEMLHAADHPVLRNTNALFYDLRNDIYAGSDDFFNRSSNEALVALFNTLMMFNHYRAEGVAILGEHLLTKRRFETVVDTTMWFRRTYELTLMKSKSWAKGSKALGVIFDDDAYRSAYMVAPSIMLLVLSKRGEIEKQLATRAKEGLDYGDIELTDDEVEAIIRSSMSLSLSEYILGIVSLGEVLAPAKPFLEFCALVQKDWENNNIMAFSQFISRPQTKETFDASMRQILGCVMSVQEIDHLYVSSEELFGDDPLYPKIKENIDRLYEILKNTDDVERKRIAQWALTYLFDDQDVIHDDVKGLGYVDDLAVMDYALRLLEK